MQPTLPPKLRPGAHVRVVAPSTSMGAVHVPWPWHDIAQRRLAERGWSVSFGERALERDDFSSSPVEARLDDLHSAFADPEVDGIFTFLGGFHANQILGGLDMDLIRANPKVFCGYSDITVLHHALLTGAGLISYSGPHYTTFGMRDRAEQTLTWFDACVMGSDPVEVRPASQWTDDAWFLDQDNRVVEASQGWWVLREGEAQGRLLGGNLCTLNLLQGTRWFPDLEGAVLIVEDDAESNLHAVTRNLQSLLHQPGGDRLGGVVIGRVQRASEIGRQDVEAIVERLPQLHDVPVVANADIGHTDPFFTFPVGGEARLHASHDDPHLVLLRH